MITAALRETEKQEQPLREMKEGAARLRGRVLGSAWGPRAMELDGWVSGAQRLHPDVHNPDSGIYRVRNG